MSRAPCCSGAAARRAEELGVEVAISLTHTGVDGRARWRSRWRDDAAGWCAPLLDAERVRAADRWAIDVAGVPSLELMERASRGARRPRDGGGARRGGSSSSAARATTAATATPRRGCCAGRAARCVVLAAKPGRGALRRRAGARPSACPAIRRARSPPAALDGAAVVVDALLGTGFAGEPRGADRRGGRRRSAALRRAGRGLRRAQRRRRLDRRGRRRGRRAPSRPRRSTPPSRGCTSIPARRTPGRCA